MDIKDNSQVQCTDKFLDKKAGSGKKAEELHKPVIGKFKTRNV